MVATLILVRIDTYAFVATYFNIIFHLIIFNKYAVWLQCGGDCNNMDIFCPKSNNGIKNCEIICLGSNDCTENNIYIYDSNLQSNGIGLNYQCSLKKDLCQDSMISCSYKNNIYQENCEWQKVEINGDLQWNCDLNGNCQGPQTIGFLSGWESISTVVFVVMMAFGILVVLGIFIWTMKEKYDEYQSNKEQQRKRSKRHKSKEQNIQRKRSILGLVGTGNDNDDYNETRNDDYNNDESNGQRRMYQKGHKLSGSYYKAPKQRKQTREQEDSVRRKKHNKSAIDEDAEYEYDPNRPQDIAILEEATSAELETDEDYDDDDDEDEGGMIIEEEYDDYDNDVSIIEEEESSVSIQSNWSTYSIKSTKSTKSSYKNPKISTKAKKKVKPKPLEAVLSFSSVSKQVVVDENNNNNNNNDAVKNKKKKKKKSCMLIHQLKEIRKWIKIHLL